MFTSLVLINNIYHRQLILRTNYDSIVAEGQGNTVGLIVFVYSDQISTIISNKIR